MNRRGVAGAALGLVWGALAVAAAWAEPGRPVTEVPVMSPERLALTAEYARIHYGLDTTRLDDPSMIVVHFTGTDSLSGSLDTFRPASNANTRPDLASGGALNVGIHWVVASDGRLFRLVPEDVMARHVVGFNHRALGIELVGSREGKLTEAQLDAAAWLVAGMKERHPTVVYLFGHHEYRDPARAHYSFYEDRQEGYRPPKKEDPGPGFMARLRGLLADRYRLTFLD